MTEESETSLSSQQPRHCPACGMKVAARATQCLMCNTALPDLDELGSEARKVGRVPSWVGSIVVGLVAVVIVTGGGVGVYRLLAVEPEAETPTPMVTPSATPTPTDTPTPTNTPPPTNTPTPIPQQTHVVEEGETMSDIAKAYGVTVEQILALNSDVDLELIRPGQVLLIPPAREEGGFTVHVVREGESLGRVAQGYGVPLSVLSDANDLRSQDDAIRAGQSLIIPLTTPTPTPTPPAVLDVGTSPVDLYPPPPLLYPPEGTAFSDGAPVLLQWASVSLLRSGEWYELSISQPARGVVSDTIRTRATAWRVPLESLERAAADVPEFRWQVRVVRETEPGVYEQVGAPSVKRSFVWRVPTPTASPTAPR